MKPEQLVGGMSTMSRTFSYWWLDSVWEQDVTAKFPKHPELKKRISDLIHPSFVHAINSSLGQSSFISSPSYKE